MNFLLKRITKPRIWKKLFKERLGEPFIYNFISLFVLISRDFSKKIDYDLVPRYPYAFGIKEAFKIARLEKVKKEYRNTNYIGIGLTFLFLIQLWLLTG